MKNKEKYEGFLTECLVNGRRFGVDEATRQPFLCDNMTCSNCKFRNLGKSCANFRTEWLEEEHDKWEGYSHLKRGDVVFVKMGTIWLPVIFVCFENNELVYTSCADDDGEFPCHVDKVSDPRHVRKDIRRVELRYEE